MPIYAYKCDSCGFAKDVLQKISDDPLSDCPSCGQAAFQKQVTAAGFQLKGTGWYVTDFRGGKADTSGDKAATGAAAPATTASTDAASSAAPANAAAPVAAAPVPATPASTPATSSAAPAAST